MTFYVRKTFVGHGPRYAVCADVDHGIPVRQEFAHYDDRKTAETIRQLFEDSSYRP